MVSIANPCDNKMAKLKFYPLNFFQPKESSLWLSNHLLGCAEQRMCVSVKTHRIYASTCSEHPLCVPVISARDVRCHHVHQFLRCFSLLVRRRGMSRNLTTCQRIHRAAANVQL